MLYLALKKDSVDMKYTGNLVDDCFSGHGNLRKFFRTGYPQYEYIGRFQKDLFSGQGALKLFSDREAETVLENYDGEWKNNKRHGKGKCLYQDGSCHVGVWVNHRIHGLGSCTYPADFPFSFRYFFLGTMSALLFF